MSADSQREGKPPNPLSSLRRFVRPRVARERCELCDAGLSANHPHLVEISSGRLACACDPCAILFSNRSATKYRRVPRRIQFLSDFQLTDEAWESLHLPINLAFFVNSTREGHTVALYPSPAGVMESLVTLETWQELVADNPILHEFEPDVEALLVNRIRSARECFRVGIDACYQLAGLIRTHWRGLSGGVEVWKEIERFFAGLKQGNLAGGETAHA